MRSEIATDTMLWAGVLAGPLVWSADLLISYSTVPHACKAGVVLPLHLYSLAAAGVALAGYWMARAALHRVQSHQNPAAGRASRGRFLAFCGMFLNCGFGLLIVAMAIPRFVLSPCD
jgi:hypothetical protein